MSRCRNSSAMHAQRHEHPPGTAAGRAPVRPGLRWAGPANSPKKSGGTTRVPPPLQATVQLNVMRRPPHWPNLSAAPTRSHRIGSRGRCHCCSTGLSPTRSSIQHRLRDRPLPRQTYRVPPPTESPRSLAFDGALSPLAVGCRSTVAAEPSAPSSAPCPSTWRSDVG